MISPFRSDTLSILLLCACAQLAASAWSQHYPSRPIRYIVPSSAGSGNDFMARIMAADMGQALNQQIVVDNRAGAGGNIAGELGANAPADGYTIMQTSVTLAINATLHKKLAYNIIKDFAPVTLLAIQPNLLTITASIPATSVAELIKYAKAKPGAINFASAGLGSNSFLAAEYLATLAGVKFTHIPYKGGGPAIAAVATGEAHIMVGPIPTAAPFIQQGRMRGVAVSSSKRLPDFPNIPTIAETVPGYEFDNWYGMLVPAKTPKDIVTTLHRVSTGALRKPHIVKQLANAGYVPVGNQPAEFDAFHKAEIAKLAKIIKQTGVTSN